VFREYILIEGGPSRGKRRTRRRGGGGQSGGRGSVVIDTLPWHAYVTGQYNTFVDYSAVCSMLHGLQALVRGEGGGGNIVTISLENTLILFISVAVISTLGYGS